VIAALVCGLNVPLLSTPLTINFVGAQLPPNSTNVGLPFLLDNITDVLFLKYKVPSMLNVIAINSLTVTINVFDDDDGGMESGHIDFALPGSNLLLTGFFANIRTFTATSPLPLTASLCQCEIAQVLPSMLDGNFRIRIARDSGDFYVLGGTVDIDAVVAPEPASISTAAGGLAFLAALVRLKRRAD